MSGWNPDSGLPLTSPAISVAGVEETSAKAWAEFLKGWFDGGVHQLRGSSITIPALAALTFQEMPVTPVDGLYLQVTTERPSTQIKRPWPDGRWMVTERVKVSFWFRAKVKTARPDGENSISLIRKGSDLLFAILSSNLLIAPLNLVGMTNFCPTPPKLVSGVINPMRLLSLTVTYTYPQEELVGQSAVTDAVGQSIFLGGPDSNICVVNGRMLTRNPDDGRWYDYGPRSQQGQVVWGQSGDGVDLSATVGVPSVGSSAASTRIIYLGPPTSNVRIKDGQMQVKNPDENPPRWYNYSPRTQDGQVIWVQSGDGDLT